MVRCLVACAAVLALAVSAPAASAVPPYRGVQLHSLWFSSTNADMDRELDAARALGSTAVRVDVVWASLETDAKGAFSSWYVDKLDRFMAGARARGMKVIATLWGTPCWAADAPDSVKQGCAGDWWNRGINSYPPVRVSDYADAAGWLTARYGGDLAALEVWNEPNLADGTFWNSPDPAGDYAALLRAAYPAAKAGDPSVPVLAGALGGDDLRFIAALYADGARGCYDGVSVHPYSGNAGPDELAARLGALRLAMLGAGDTTGLWITEFGWSTASPGGVTEAQQASYLAQAFATLDSLDDVQSAIVYNLRDKGTDPTSREDNFGLLGADYAAKPAFTAVADALSSTPPAPTQPKGVKSFPATPESGAPTSGPETPASGVAKQDLTPGLRAKVVTRHGVAYLRGRGPASRRLRVELRGCDAGRPKARSVRIDADGRFAARLGSAARVRGCTVVATAGRARTRLPVN